MLDDARHRFEYGVTIGFSNRRCRRSALEGSASVYKFRASFRVAFSLLVRSDGGAVRRPAFRRHGRFVACVSGDERRRLARGGGVVLLSFVGRAPFVVELSRHVHRRRGQSHLGRGERGVFLSADHHSLARPDRRRLGLRLRFGGGNACHSGRVGGRGRAHQGRQSLPHHSMAARHGASRLRVVLGPRRKGERLLVLFHRAGVFVVRAAAHGIFRSGWPKRAPHRRPSRSA